MLRLEPLGHLSYINYLPETEWIASFRITKVQVQPITDSIGSLTSFPISYFSTTTSLIPTDLFQILESSHVSYGVAYTRYANRTYGYFTLFSHGLLNLSFFSLDHNQIKTSRVIRIHSQIQSLVIQVRWNSNSLAHWYTTKSNLIQIKYGISLLVGTIWAESPYLLSILYNRICLFFCYFVLYNSFVYGIISPEGFQSMGA